VFSDHNKCAYSEGRNSEFALIFVANDNWNMWLCQRPSAIQNSSNQLTKQCLSCTVELNYNVTKGINTLCRYERVMF
jgi:hypothetical protein